MNRLYSKSALVLKSACCLLLSLVYVLISALVTVENSFLNVLISIIPIGCLYTVPFWLSASALKKFRVDGIKAYVLLDGLCCLIPAFLGMLICDIVMTVINGSSVADGISTLIFGIIFVLITLIFWLIYLVLSRRK